MSDKTYWFEKDGQILCKWYNDDARVNITVREGEPLHPRDVALLLNKAYYIGQKEKQQEILNVLGVK